MAIMLIGWGMGVAVGSGGTGVAVRTDAGINVLVFVAVAVLTSGTEIFAGMTTCFVQALIKRAMFTKTNKVFFILELLTH